jgi:hypothetical protein
MVGKMNGPSTPAGKDGVPRSAMARGSAGVAALDPKIANRQPRRNHTVAYRIKIVEEDKEFRAGDHGARETFLRREGLNYSRATRWEGELNRNSVIKTNLGD